MSAAAGTAAIWHDVECGGYEADLALWEEMAERAGGTVLELGCGTGRVALHLARRGHEVIGLDRDPELTAAFAARATGLDGVRALTADARAFELDAEVALALAPMQFLQLLATPAERMSCLSAVAAALRPGGRCAAAIVERMPVPVEVAPALPDVREVDGWVYSSLPVEAVVGDGEIALRRLRQTVSPGGELREELDEVRLAELDANQLEVEAAAARLRPVGRRRIAETDAHVGSTVVVLESEA